MRTTQNSREWQRVLSRASDAGALGAMPVRALARLLIAMLTEARLSIARADDPAEAEQADGEVAEGGHDVRSVAGVAGIGVLGVSGVPQNLACDRSGSFCPPPNPARATYRPSRRSVRQGSQFNERDFEDSGSLCAL